MDLSGYIAVPEWKQFIRLGEQLLNLPRVSERCELIESIVKEHLHCNAHIWLVEPYYPVPGEEEVCTIPSTPVDEIVSRALETGEILFQAGPQTEIQTFSAPCEARVIAYPVKTKDDLMAVMYVAREEPFCQDDWKFLDGFLTMVSLALEVSRQVSIKNWRARQLGLVQSVSEQIANMTDLNHLCVTVTDLIHEMFDFYYVAIYILDKDAGHLNLMAMQHLSDCSDFAPAYQLESGKGIVGYVALSGKELMAPDVRSEPRYRYIDCLPETRSELALPLKTEDRIYGVLDLQSDRLNGFHDNDQVVLRALANNIALAIESTDLYQNLQQRINQIETVVEFSHALTSILDLEQLIEKVSQLIHDRFHYPYVHVYTYHPVRNKVIFGTGVGARSEAMQAHEIAYDLDDPHGIIPWVARNKKSYLSNDVLHEPLFRKLNLPPDNTLSELAVPVLFAGEVLGILDLQSDHRNAFDEEDVELLEALASTVAIAVRNAIQYRTEKWRVQVADSFREVSELISSNRPLDDVLEAILQKLEENLPCQASAIWLLSETNIDEDDRPQLTLAAAHGVGADTILQALNDEGVQWMLDKGLGNLHPTIRQPNDPSGPLGLALGFPQDYSSIAAPLRAGEKTLGILTLAHQTPGRYGNEAHDMTATFASYAAVAIQNARLFEEAQEQAWVSTVLLQVSEASQSASTVDELLTTMVRLPPLLIGVRFSAIFLWSDDEEAFHLKNWYGLKQDPIRTTFHDYDTPALARLAATRSAIFIEDVVTELNLPQEYVPDEIGTMVMVPLISRGNLLGALLVGYKQRTFIANQEDLHQQILAILQGISHQTAVALENLRLEEAQEEEAYVTAVLLEVAQAVVSQNELDDVLETIVHLMPILVGIDTCVIYLWNREQEIFQPVQAYAGTDEDEIHLLEKTYKAGEFPLLDQTLESDHLHFSTSPKMSLNIDQWRVLSAHHEEDLSQGSILPGGSILLSVPLSARGDAFGIMLAKETMSSLAFQEKRMEIITGIAQQVSLAIQNEKYKQDLVETQRMEQELELARQSQTTFLPAELPRLYRWELDARWTPAREVGGDFYDIIQLDRDRIGLVIADVADKGMAAALYMTVTRTLIRAYSQNESSPGMVLEKVNSMLLPDSQESMFVTAVYAILNKRSNKITYANAGHNLPLLIRENEVMKLKKGGISLGVLDNIHLVEHEEVIQPGDILLMYTDGVTEAFNEQDEVFGDDRLAEFARSHIDCTAEEFLDQLVLEIKAFAGDTPPSDDITMVCLKRQP